MAKKNRIFTALAAGVAALGALFASRSASAADTVDTRGPIPVQPGQSESVLPRPRPTAAPPVGSSPLGLRNNNPFNLEFRDIGWIGEIGTDGRFSIFDNAENGIRAGMINIHTKMIRDGANTVRKLLTRLSPAFENPLEAFINFVSQRLSVAPDQPLDWRQHILQLSKAIIQFENGSQPFSDAELQNALARTGRV